MYSCVPYYPNNVILVKTYLAGASFIYGAPCISKHETQ